MNIHPSINLKTGKTLSYQRCINHTSFCFRKGTRLLDSRHDSFTCSIAKKYKSISYTILCMTGIKHLKCLRFRWAKNVKVQRFRALHLQMTIKPIVVRHKKVTEKCYIKYRSLYLFFILEVNTSQLEVLHTS